jgi:hypothetical protein
MPKRLEIGYEYLDVFINQWPERPSRWQMATKAKICQSTARKIIMELENTGSLTDPDLIIKNAQSQKKVLLGSLFVGSPFGEISSSKS